MELDNLSFKPIQKGRHYVKQNRNPHIRLIKRSNTVKISINRSGARILNNILNDYNAVEIMFAGDSFVGIKPVINEKWKSQGQTTFTATGLIECMSDIPYDKKIMAAEHKGMLVCDLLNVDGESLVGNNENKS